LKKGPHTLRVCFTGYGYTIPEHALHRTLEDKPGVLEGGYLGWAGSLLGGMMFGMVHLAQLPNVCGEDSLAYRIAATATRVAPLIWGARGVWRAAFYRIR